MRPPIAPSPARSKTRSISAWAANPNPGRISAVHRLNRAEYNNAIRDLFALDLDVKPLLPGDETADGSFDNFADVLSISTAHLERYMSVARQVTRLATGLPPAQSEARDISRSRCTCCRTTGRAKTCRSDRAAASRFTTTFPVDGEYLIKVRLQRQYQDYLKGMGWPQKLDVRLDGKLLKRFTVGGAAQRPACRGQLRRRRRAGFRGRSRMGKVHAAHRRRRAWRSASR